MYNNWDEPERVPHLSVLQKKLCTYVCMYVSSDMSSTCSSCACVHSVPQIQARKDHQCMPRANSKYTCIRTLRIVCMVLRSDARKVVKATECHGIKGNTQQDNPMDVHEAAHQKPMFTQNANI